jgi:hypothetical protein
VKLSTFIDAGAVIGWWVMFLGAVYFFTWLATQ